MNLCANLWWVDDAHGAQTQIKDCNVHENQKNYDIVVVLGVRYVVFDVLTHKNEKKYSYKDYLSS